MSDTVLFIALGLLSVVSIVGAAVWAVEYHRYFTRHMPRREK